jgi:hypothetical protein
MLLSAFGGIVYNPKRNYETNMMTVPGIEGALNDVTVKIALDSNSGHLRQNTVEYFATGPSELDTLNVHKAVLC